MLFIAKVEQTELDASNQIDFLIEAQELNDAMNVLLQSYAIDEIKQIKEIKNISVLNSDRSIFYLATYVSNFEDKTKKVKCYISANSFSEALTVFKDRVQYADEIISIVKTTIQEYIYNHVNNE